MRNSIAARMLRTHVPRASTCAFGSHAFAAYISRERVRSRELETRLLANSALSPVFHRDQGRCRANRKNVTKPLPARRKMDDDEQATTVGAVGDEKCDVESAAFFQQLKTNELSAVFDFDLPAQWRTQWAYDCDAAASSVDTQIPPLAKVMWESRGIEPHRAAPAET